jgi:hypothetical protein
MKKQKNSVEFQDIESGKEKTFEDNVSSSPAGGEYEAEGKGGGEDEAEGQGGEYEAE